MSTAQYLTLVGLALIAVGESRSFGIDLKESTGSARARDYVAGIVAECQIIAGYVCIAVAVGRWLS